MPRGRPKKVREIDPIEKPTDRYDAIKEINEELPFSDEMGNEIIYSDITGDLQQKPKEVVVRLDAQREKSKRLYMLGVMEDVIHKVIGINERQLGYWIHGPMMDDTHPECWKKLRDDATDAVVMFATRDRLTHLVKCIAVGGKVLHDSLEVLAKDVSAGEKLSVKDIKMVSEIITNLDKIARLETGSPTEIVKRAGLSIDEAKKILASDPFAFGIVKAEVVKSETRDVEE